MIALKYRQFWK